MTITLDKIKYDLKIYTEAIRELYPDIMFVIQDYILTIDNTYSYNPTFEEIMEKAKEIKENYDANFYKILRKKEYEKLNQFELLYNDMINNTTTWQSEIYKIKSKYPKPR